MLQVEYVILMLWWQKDRFLKEKKSALFRKKVYVVLGQVLNKQVLLHHQEDPHHLFPFSKASLNLFNPQSNFQWSKQGHGM